AKCRKLGATSHVPAAVERSLKTAAAGRPDERRCSGNREARCEPRIVGQALRLLAFYCHPERKRRSSCHFRARCVWRHQASGEIVRDPSLALRMTALNERQTERLPYSFSVSEIDRLFECLSPCR